MRRAGKACSPVSHALARAFLLCAALLLGIGHAHAAMALHIEAAQLRQEAAGSYAPPDPVLRLAPGNWQPVALPHVLPRQLVPGGEDSIVTAWYRVDVPEAARALPPAGLKLYLPRWQTIGQIAVYADDRLVFRSGAGPVWNGFNHPLWLTLNGVAEASAPRAVTIRVDHLRSAGAGVSSVWLGDEAGLRNAYRLREWLQTDLPYLGGAAFLVIGLFALAVWVARREAMYGLFFLSSLLFFVRCLHYHLGLEPLPISEEWFGWLTLNSLSWLVVTVFFFGFRLNARRYPRLEWALIALVMLGTVVSAPPFAVLPALSQVLPLAYLGMMVATIGLSGLGLWAAWRGGSRDAMLVAVWNAMNIPAGVHDWLLQNYRIDIEHAYLMPYTAIGLFMAFMAVVLRRYVGALREGERAREGLAAQLAERETQLAESYQRLRAVEHERLISQERQRLMQDMHDGLGSSLMSALKAVEKGAAPDVAQVLRECIDDLKLAIDSLEPVQADLLLLLATLRFRLGSRLEQAGLRLNWEVEDVPPVEWLDASSALHLLRIVQEVLSNAIKHSGATELRLATSHGNGRVVISIADNGQGFDQSLAVRSGRGLANVTRRAAAIGALAAWHRTGTGTLFELALPLVQPQPAPSQARVTASSA